jgi:cytochrome c-type biogenesis protein CcmH
MLFGLTLAVLIAATLFALLWPLFRTSETEQPRAVYDMAIYRDQLDEISRDVARGVLNETEAAAARLEIERRLLASQPRSSKTPQATGPGLPRAAVLAVAIATAIAVPAVALGLYLTLGSPTLPDKPLAERQVERKVLAEDGSLDMKKAKAMLEERLAVAPDNIQGWFLLARADSALGDWDGVRAAFDRVLTLSNRSPDMLEAYGDLLITQADGEVTPEAETVLKEALQAKPELFRSRYYLALDKAQHEDVAGALADWRAMLAAAPSDAPYAGTLKKVIAEAEQEQGGGGTPPAPVAAAATPTEGQRPPPEMAAIMKLPPNEQLNAIRGMVAGLAAKLEQNPSDLEGWKRLGRSYHMLGDQKKSADAYGKAAALAPDDTSLLVGEADAMQTDVPDGAPIPPEVADLYRKILAREPDQQNALWFLGMAEKQSGNPAAAAANWQRLLAQLKPDTPQAKAVQEQLSSVAGPGN